MVWRSEPFIGLGHGVGQSVGRLRPEPIRLGAPKRDRCPAREFNGPAPRKSRNCTSMDVTPTAFGTWNGGRFMNYGQPLDDAQWIATVRHAWDRGIRTFLTADVYGAGQADSLLGQALSGVPRDSYCLVGCIGHDFYSARRDGAKGFPRFTQPGLRVPADHASYLRMATEKSLERCRTDHFDLVLLHNPDHTGYTSDRVWNGMQTLREAGLTRSLGVAPGPANGFTLDLIRCFERFGPLIDWAMIILGPFEPWPGRLILPAAVRHEVKLITRVVDYGGIFHDDVRPGHRFGTADHRSFRPAGWVEAAVAKLEALRPIAQRHGITPLQLACTWNLHQPAVHNVIPTLIQELGEGARPIASKVDELAALKAVRLSPDEVAEIARIGDNTGCMALKGSSRSHVGSALPDQWELDPELESIATRWNIDPKTDLGLTHSH
jgi:aryl-alcohol dehydrogenase-like predicted oxidoreductase